MRRRAERIFARTWQWIGDLADVADAGSLSPRELLRGVHDEPLLLRARPRRDAALPVERVYPSRQHPDARALHRGRPDSLRLPFATLRSFRAHDLHAGVRRSEKLPLGKRRPAADTVYRLGESRLRIARPGRTAGSVSGRLDDAPSVAAARAIPARPDVRAATTSSTRIGRSTSRTFLKPCTSRSSTRRLSRVMDCASYEHELFRYSSLQLAPGQERGSCLRCAGRLQRIAGGESPRTTGGFSPI